MPPTTWFGFYTARAFYELGRLAENRGDPEQAALHYGRALEYWDHGGPAVEDWRTLARRALERISPERRQD